jgi:hypothetical protein
LSFLSVDLDIADDVPVLPVRGVRTSAGAAPSQRAQELGFPRLTCL